MRNWYWSLAVFTGICLFGYAARQAIGNIYSSGEAIVLLESLGRSGLYLGSAGATASATTLALMLTLIGMVRRADQDFSDQVYVNIDSIAKLATASLMASLILLLVLVFPVGEFDDMPENWYPRLYEGLFALTVMVVALLSSTVTMLYRTVRHVIAHITPGQSVSS